MEIIREQEEGCLSQALLRNDDDDEVVVEQLKFQVTQ